MDELKIYECEKHGDVDPIFEEIRRDCLEMAQLKSNFDIEKFTIKKEGHFLCHQFHFLMRQYSLTLQEFKKVLVRRERILRKMSALKKRGRGLFGNNNPDADLDMAELSVEMESIEIHLTDRRCRLSYFEKCRKKLIEENGGPFTNEQYQAEVPKYWEWFFKRQALLEHRQAATGVTVGTQLNIEHVEQPAVLDDSFQLNMKPLDENGELSLGVWEREIEEGKKTRHQRVLNGTEECG